MSEVLLQQIISELKDLKSGQRNMEKRFDEMQGQMNSMQGQMGGMHGQLDGMHGQMNSMQGQMDGMQGQLDRIESKQNAIFEQTGQLTEFRQETLTKFDEVVKKEDMFYFEFKLMEHDRDLFNLKKRA
ncbi:hypothetical protein DVB69_15985 [Sporosarcina sp. BI001-red]|uniref:hypothetical protein n=1 Tax=Sporosarcina sp. BI001-red TaxID=2282866 RepID=UPI000E225910|nr:hypothetical protein [Sporosarcina sp. BI001-red]REB05252.1 hypothetical protein DVB69_15985 [Sporosarcina sp. BI001-red]